jgi:hypothetical protein
MAKGTAVTAALLFAVFASPWTHRLIRHAARRVIGHSPLDRAGAAAAALHAVLLGVCAYVLLALQQRCRERQRQRFEAAWAALEAARLAQAQAQAQTQGGGGMNGRNQLVGTRGRGVLMHP